MHERTTRKSLEFLHPFSLAGVDGMLGPGTYTVETLEELIEGLSFIAYRRVSTTIEMCVGGFGPGARQIIAIDPLDLQMAQERDAIESPSGLLAHGIIKQRQHAAKRSKEFQMNSDFIRVTERPESLWTVLREPRGECLLGFKTKSHAVAYARAVSFSGKLSLFVDDRNGVAIRQSPASLTYPVMLN